MQSHNRTRTILLKACLLIVILVFSAGFSFARTPYPGNDSDHGVTVPWFPYPYTGNFSFSTKDITVAGAVGEYGLYWQRYGSSRASKLENLFGLGHNWAHSWQWEMVSVGNDSEGREMISVRYPNGRVYRFTQTSPGEWWSTPSVRDRVVSKGNSFTLLERGGAEAKFRRGQSNRGDIFTLETLSDTRGNIYKLTYSGNSLVKVSEPAGRWLKIDYESLSIPNAPKAAPPYKVISRVTSSDGQVVAYGYEFPENNDYPVLSEVTYPDESTASYTYTKQRKGMRMLLEKADDPKGDSNLRGRYFRYRTEPDAAFGQLLDIRAAEGGAVMQALAADEGNLRGYAIKQTNGATVYQYYNPGGNFSEKIDALGFPTEYEFSHGGRGLLTAEVDPLGQTIVYEYNTAGDMIKIVNPDNSERSWVYDDKGRILIETDELGYSKIFKRDDKGREVKVEYPDGSTMEFTYNNLGQKFTQKNPGGDTLKYYYDDRGLCVSIESELGNKSYISYDDNDNIACAIDPLGNMTFYESDLNGRVRKIIYPDDEFAEYQYNPFGDLILSTNQGCSTCLKYQYAYDPFGRRIEVEDSIGRITTWEYAPIGKTAPFDQPIRIISPTGHITARKYDENEHVISNTVAEGTDEAATTRYGYDAAGRRNVIVEEGGKSVQLFYDARGRIIKTMGALSQVTAYNYDLVGNKLSETDPKGNTTEWTYDAMGRVLSSTDSEGHTTERLYDSGGRLISIIDASGNIYHNEYSVEGRQTSMEFPDGSYETWTYDELGRMATFTNRAGDRRYYTYDNRNREIFSEFSDGSHSIRKEYDSAGRVIVQDNGVSRLTFTYDDAGRVMSETQDLYPIVTSGRFDPKPRTVSYVYTDDDQYRSMIYPDGSSVDFLYDTRGQMIDISSDGLSVARYKYDIAGNPISIPRNNSTKSFREYDVDNKLLNITEKGPFRKQLGKIDYTYDEVGNRISTTFEIDQEILEEKYQYDSVYQVTGAELSKATNYKSKSDSTSKVRYYYDAVGNRIQVAEDGAITRYAVNELNQYIIVGEFHPTYDEKGNLSSMGDWLYTYDFMGRLVEATDGRITARFFYDSRNRCVARDYNGRVTLNTYDDWKLIEERDGADRLKAGYVHGREIDEIVLISNKYGVFYPHRDVLGNVTFVTNVEGDVVERYSYSVTGNVTIMDEQGGVLSDTTIGNRWMYTGREWLPEVGLYDYRNRMYSASLGRFLQPDPLKFRAGDVNMYRYVSNRYLNFTDPSGLVCGNGTWGDYFVPDGIPGVFQAGPPCQLHDELYDDGVFNGSTPYFNGLTPTYASGYGIINPGDTFTRYQTDQMFLSEMRTNNPSIIGQTFSYIYYAAVRLFGWIFWGGGGGGE